MCGRCVRKTLILFLGMILSLGWYTGGFSQSVPLEEEAYFEVPTHPDGIQRTTIIMESYSFSPSKLVVEAEKPIELVLGNESFLVPHNFVLDIPSAGLHIEQSVDSGDRESVRFTLEKAGEYPFYCNKQLLFFPSHQEEGMKGVIKVKRHE